ncbi:heterokaryon incompatibility protein [Colletotrichum navitas]|uniref:Heterokaryon incompatibility protein n=1 Tax=Colletotrichum navitas TaxID=681940 RepID=A0AAD8PQF2_9PEZI|nr:heterokaryon incompatibility protein [Colletotrichum navitas]KAK1573875.1 heterokaryon incompatibility protein [Colletotrichum navitas]
MPLCTACSRLDLGDLLDEDDELQDMVLHDSVAILKEGTSSCDLCRLLYNSITDKLKGEGVSIDESAWSDPDSRVILRGIQYQDEDYLPCGLIWVKVRCASLGHRAYSYFGLYPEEGTPGLEGVVIGRPIKPPGEQIGLVSDWVKSCDRNHKGCHSDPCPLPTRVVDVGLDGHREPRLVVTGGAAGRYTTLSHCWGSHPVIRTTSRTIEDHLRALPLETLPKTFRDAVLITRSLGIQYIWIDSLCIVQDSTEDWELESVKMGTIYASSYLTIAASASKDSTGGCFMPRNTSIDVKVRFTVRNSGDPRPTSVFVRPRPRDFSHLPMSALHVRAWVTQERLLSARMIHYDADQLLWECRESRLTEDGVPVGAFSVARNVEWDERLHFSYPFSQSRSRPNFVWDWYDMVSAYSSRGITKSHDRLPALSGLAKAMEECTGQKYVAGLWKFHLGYGLLWRRSEQWLRKPGDGYRAPSWSWASLEGRVFMPEIATMVPYGNEMEIMIDIVDVHTTPLGLDPRGMLRSGYIKLKGKLKVADSRVDPATPGHKWFAKYQNGLAVDFLNYNDEMVGVAYFDEEYHSGKEERPLHYLQVARRLMEPSRWHGLLLEPTDEKNQFRRVGFCRTEEFPSRDWFANADEETIMIV